MKSTSVLLSEKGPVRVINADAVLADDEHRFYAIADGVGSADASARASRFAVEEAHRQYLACVAGPDDIDPCRLLERIVPEYARRFADEPRIPSTTLTVFWIAGEALHMSSVGDSPLFLIDEGHTHLLTREHTAIDRHHAIADFSSLKSMSGSNVLVNTFGASPARPIQYSAIDLRGGQRLVACTDGLMELINQGELSDPSYVAASDFLTDVQGRASRQPAPDNFSVLVVDLMKEA